MPNYEHHPKGSEMRFMKENWDMVAFPGIILLLAAALHFFGIAEASWLELGAILGAIISRPLLKREKISGMLLGGGANLLFILYFLQIHLAGQLILSAVFLMLNVVGIYSWLRPGTKARKLLRPAFVRPLWRVGIVFAVAAAAIFGAACSGTVGALDYFVMAAGIMGMILLLRKKTDAWVSYLASDSAAIALFWMTGSYLMFAAAFEYVYSDVTSFFRWRKVSRRIKKRAK